MEAARRRACLILALAALGGCGGSDDEPACRVDRGVLPEWARAGFSESAPRAPHVVGRSGEIAAVLFGDPLTAPPRPDRGNKILWVARETPPLGDLEIQAQRPGGKTVRRVVKRGPGPSIIDLPAPGCWRLTLTWAGHRDTLDLEYHARQ